MRRLPIQLLTAAAFASAISLIGVSAGQASATARPHPGVHVANRPNLITGTGFGTGHTSAAARDTAIVDLDMNYFGCTNIFVVFDTQGSNGIWSAEVSATCGGIQ